MGMNNVAELTHSAVCHQMRYLAAINSPATGSQSLTVAATHKKQKYLMADRNIPTLLYL